MIRVKLLAFIFPILILPSVVAAIDGVRTEVVVSQKNPQDGSNVLLFRDTVDLEENRAMTSFLADMSVDFDLVDTDSTGAVFNIYVVTLGPPSKTYSRRFQVEYGLPATISEIAGKDSCLYTLQARPIEAVQIDSTDCNFDHRSKDDFKFDPSAHMDIYYVPNSFGDFYWSGAKAILEGGYRRFKKRFNLNLPGKYLIYLSPCELHTVLWDMRFGMSVNPSKSTAFAIFSKTFSAVDPFLVNYAASLRTFGYSPPLLAEGLAGYFSMPAFDMKRIAKEWSGKSLLDSLVNTREFLTADPTVADRSAASFSRFLIDQYGDDKFFKAYREANDLNLGRTLESVFGKPLPDLETEWRNYIDTFTVSIDYLADLTDRAEAALNYPVMSTYAEAMFDISKSADDSLRSLSRVGRSAFFRGNYYRASEAEELSLRIENDASRLMTLGTYQMMNGQYDQAKANLDRALKLNSSNQLIKFNLGLWNHVTGDDEQARKYWTDIIVNPVDASAEAESRIMLGHLLLKTGNAEDHSQALTYLSQGVGLFQQTTQTHEASSQTELWTGIGFAGLGDTQNAFSHLSTALFLETRAFHLGLINLWLGKVADLMGERQVAIEYYGKVLSLPSAVYHQDEARKYLKEAFRE